ncbi:esterase-like activity of phytase family protein [Prevotella sp. E13-17]|uniref:esterase-like activity of phytase family protein n=1 Tax=Prevotella sp. E13-17 TaxID=2913616 RepID=UPI001EDC0E7D|nr:esterase-like activity of phytase family protein [Prevotella sp. E13-17]UKK52104.1 esterase-like activity of phytase family protein [Prevotella sp. E13-17]
MMGRTIVIVIAVLLVPLSLFSQRFQKFPRQIPAGNYSGLCAIGNDCYAVVNDKSDGDGFYVMRMKMDTVRGRITDAELLGFRSSGLANRDAEGICYCPSSNTLFIAGERDNEVYEYDMDGRRTGRRLAMPEMFRKANANYGLESLTYDRGRHLFFTTTEHPLDGDSLLRIQSFTDDLLPARQYFYRPDARMAKVRLWGVSELCALRDGRLLVVERQVRIPKLKLGAQCIVRIYAVNPGDSANLEKTLVREIKTRLTLTRRKFANIEGLTEPLPGLLLMVADSQDQYKGVLRDWFLLMKE